MCYKSETYPRVGVTGGVSDRLVPLELWFCGAGEGERVEGVEGVERPLVVPHTSSTPTANTSNHDKHLKTIYNYYILF